MHEKPAETRGLVLFGRNTEAAHRQRRLTFVALVIVVTAMLVWPLNAWVARVFPLVLGLPLSLAWIILALAMLFGGLIWLFVNENDSADGSEG